MLVVFAIAAGALFGWQRAARRGGGDRLDQLQYAAVHAILFGLVAMILVVAAGRIPVA